MSVVKKLLICFLIVLTLNLYLSNTAISQQLYAKADVPKHDPQSWSTPEIEFPTVKVKKSNWLLWVLGIAVVAGGAAAAAGGAKEEGGDGGDGVDTGSINITW